MGRFRTVMAAALAGLLASSATGCATASDAEEPEAPRVLTTFTVLADIAQAVAGDAITVESIVPIGAEIHGFEPSPRDIARAADADLIFDNGLGLEAWFEQFIAQSDAARVTVSVGIEPIDITEEADAGLPNPHAWMSPLNAKIYADNIAAALADFDPPNAEGFAARSAAYGEQLQQVHDDLLERLAQVPAAQRSLVTCEGAFSYLARDAGLAEHFIWAVNAERQATPRRVAGVIDHVREQRIPAVFCESTVSDAAMRQVISATDAAFGGVLYVDSLTGPDGPAPTYLDLIRHDTEVIARALTGEPR